jgi:hypothetical protein
MLLSIVANIPSDLCPVRHYRIGPEDIDGRKMPLLGKLRLRRGPFVAATVVIYGTQDGTIDA